MNINLGLSYWLERKIEMNAITKSMSSLNNIETAPLIAADYATNENIATYFERDGDKNLEQIKLINLMRITADHTYACKHEGVVDNYSGILEFQEDNCKNIVFDKLGGKNLFNVPLKKPVTDNGVEMKQWSKINTEHLYTKKLHKDDLKSGDEKGSRPTIETLTCVNNMCHKSNVSKNKNNRNNYQTVKSAILSVSPQLANKGIKVKKKFVLLSDGRERYFLCKKIVGKKLKKRRPYFALLEKNMAESNQEAVTLCSMTEFAAGGQNEGIGFVNEKCENNQVPVDNYSRYENNENCFSFNLLNNTLCDHELYSFLNNTDKSQYNFNRSQNSLGNRLGVENDENKLTTIMLDHSYTSRSVIITPPAAFHINCNNTADNESLDSEGIKKNNDLVEVMNRKSISDRVVNFAKSNTSCRKHKLCCKKRVPPIIRRKRNCNCADIKSTKRMNITSKTIDHNNYASIGICTNNSYYSKFRPKFKNEKTNNKNEKLAAPVISLLSDNVSTFDTNCASSYKKSDAVPIELVNYGSVFSDEMPFSPDNNSNSNEKIALCALGKSRIRSKAKIDTEEISKDENLDAVHESVMNGYEEVHKNCDDSWKQSGKVDKATSDALGGEYNLTDTMSILVELQKHSANPRKLKRKPKRTISSTVAKNCKKNHKKVLKHYNYSNIKKLKSQVEKITSDGMVETDMKKIDEMHSSRKLKNEKTVTTTLQTGVKKYEEVCDTGKWKGEEKVTLDDTVRSVTKNGNKVFSNNIWKLSSKVQKEILGMTVITSVRKNKEVCNTEKQESEEKIVYDNTVGTRIKKGEKVHKTRKLKSEDKVSLGATVGTGIKDCEKVHTRKLRVEENVDATCPTLDATVGTGVKYCEEVNDSMKKRHEIEVKKLTLDAQSKTGVKNSGVSRQHNNEGRSHVNEKQTVYAVDESVVKDSAEIYKFSNYCKNSRRQKSSVHNVPLDIVGDNFIKNCKNVCKQQVNASDNINCIDPFATESNETIRKVECKKNSEGCKIIEQARQNAGIAFDHNYCGNVLFDSKFVKSAEECFISRSTDKSCEGFNIVSLKHDFDCGNENLFPRSKRLCPSDCVVKLLKNGRSKGKKKKKTTVLSKSTNITVEDELTGLENCRNINLPVSNHCEYESSKALIINSSIKSLAVTTQPCDNDKNNEKNLLLPENLKCSKLNNNFINSKVPDEENKNYDIKFNNCITSSIVKLLNQQVWERKTRSFGKKGNLDAIKISRIQELVPTEPVSSSSGRNEVYRHNEGEVLLKNCTVVCNKLETSCDQIDKKSISSVICKTNLSNLLNDPETEIRHSTSYQLDNVRDEDKLGSAKLDRMKSVIGHSSSVKGLNYNIENDRDSEIRYAAALLQNCSSGECCKKDQGVFVCPCFSDNSESKNRLLQNNSVVEEPKIVGELFNEIITKSSLTARGSDIQSKLFLAKPNSGMNVNCKKNYLEISTERFYGAHSVGNAKELPCLKNLKSNCIPVRSKIPVLRLADINEQVKFLSYLNLQPSWIAKTKGSKKPKLANRLCTYNKNYKV